MPQREYAVETTQSSKGYRIVPSLNPNLSAVERALKDRGFTYYMPVEKRLIRDRRHTNLWKVRRFGLMTRYLFVLDPHDFGKLEKTPGVAGVIRDGSNRPLSIGLEDILLVRAVEAAAEVEFDRQSRMARQKLRKNAKNDKRLQMLIEKFDIAGTISVPLDYKDVAE